MLLIVLLSFCLVAVVFVFHHHILIWLGLFAPKLKLQPQTQVLVIVFALYIAHIVEICLYAIVYFFAVEQFDLGEFNGAPVNDLMSYIYYSGVIYTSLGLGDIYPSGHIRFLTAMETLNGFLLITWSASFTFLAMGRLWSWSDSCDSVEKKRKKEE